MVRQLELALKKVEILSEHEQQTIAAIIEAELADEAQWQRKFDATPDTLTKLAERAKRQYDQGLCGDL